MAEDCAATSTQPGPSEGPPPPTAEEFARLLNEWLAEPIAAPSLPLETLLYHGAHTRALLGTLPSETLPTDRQAFLDAELERSRAAIEVRLVDEAGNLRGQLESTGIALGVPSHLHMQGTGNLGPVELSGRVRRVGLHHLWSRW